MRPIDCYCEEIDASERPCMGCERASAVLVTEDEKRRAAQDVLQMLVLNQLVRTEQRCLRCGCTEQHACGEYGRCSSVLLQGPARFHSRTLTRLAFHPWAPLTWLAPRYQVWEAGRGGGKAFCMARAGGEVCP